MPDILAENYRLFYQEVAGFIPKQRLFSDPFRSLAYGTDASFYRLVPKIVILVRAPEEMSRIMNAARCFKVPVTFRAAGTSLSGQAVTDSVLLVISGGWKKFAVHDNGERITLEPGVIGAQANSYLSPHHRKIGPDPASINSCMIGGIAANNASGMCCGTAQNSYKTVEGMKIIFSDGAVLDTRDPGSRLRFQESHKDLLDEIVCIRDEINGDADLRQRISYKYRIKNTTGYSLNSLVDYTDPIDIALHLMIGSEGTLGFISEITYTTVVEHTHKASALVIFPDIEKACKATGILKGGPSSAVELMDRASLRSVEDRKGMPLYLKSLDPETAALLIETRADDPVSLRRQMDQIRDSLRVIPTVLPVSFTDLKEEYERLWDIRRGLFPAVGGARKIGTTVIIEDVAFPVEKLASATLELESLMKKHGYSEGIIFGHALDGNLHFVFTQDFNYQEEVKRYRSFMDDVCNLVVEKYDGSLKGEHGTGRNMAPFVALEWGRKAYDLMRRIKKAFDPDNILNPGVMINDNPVVHIENLKPLPKTHEIVDRCIECGFCEVKCPSKNITTTPRQRIVVQREISRLRAAGKNCGLLQVLENSYTYLGEQTCATDGLCATACPVSIDTGRLTKYLRSLKHGLRGVRMAGWVSGRYPLALSGVRYALKAAGVLHAVLGSSLMERISSSRWNAHMPTGISAPRFRDIRNGPDLTVVYFPSCIVRTMGPSRYDKDQRPVFEAMLSILRKAGYNVLFPGGMEKLCCGLPFESKGFFEQADRMSAELEKALLACGGDAYPVLCDTSPCLYRMRNSFTSGLKLYEPVEFIHTFLMDRLTFRKAADTVAVHVTCSSEKMGLAWKFRALAEACSERVITPAAVGCCGFAGDRGFSHPELNESALAELRDSVPADCSAGYSNSRTCEIGLTRHSGIDYQSIVYLVDKCTE